jgi:hypothetical protein
MSTTRKHIEFTHPLPGLVAPEGPLDGGGCLPFLGSQFGEFLLQQGDVTPTPTAPRTLQQAGGAAPSQQKHSSESPRQSLLVV